MVLFHYTGHMIFTAMATGAECSFLDCICFFDWVFEKLIEIDNCH